MSYFEEYTSSRSSELYQELVSGNEEKVNDILNDILMRSISYFDNQEIFYHGFLVGLFHGYEVISNREAGDGRFDLCVIPESIRGTLVIIECKHSLSDDDLIEDAEAGAKQITDRHYFEEKRLRNMYMQ